jgi:hypothetical protein
MFFAARLGWGAAKEGVQGLRWSDRPDVRCPAPVDAVHYHGHWPRTTGALVPVLLRPSVLDDEATTGLRVYVEEYAVHRVMRQFGLFQEAPVPAAPCLPPIAHK